MQGHGALTHTQHIGRDQDGGYNASIQSKLNQLKVNYRYSTFFSLKEIKILTNNHSQLTRLLLKINQKKKNKILQLFILIICLKLDKSKKK